MGDTADPRVLIRVLKSLADSGRLHLDKWNTTGSFQQYPCHMTDVEMFCRGSFEIMVTKQAAKELKLRLNSGT